MTHPRKLEVRPTLHPNQADIVREASRSPSPYDRKRRPLDNTTHTATKSPSPAPRSRTSNMTDMATKGQQAATNATAGVSDKVQSATTGILGRIESFGNWIAMKGKALLDRFFPPEQRASLLAKLQAFMLKNPKLSVRLHFPPRRWCVNADIYRSRHSSA